MKKTSVFLFLLCVLLFVYLCGCANGTGEPIPTPVPETPAPTEEISLSQEQLEMIQLFARYFHEPVESIDHLKQEPYFVFFLLNQTWLAGQADGTLMLNEDADNYGQVVIPLDMLNETALQYFGMECDQDYIRQLYEVNEEDCVLFYPSDTPFFVARVIRTQNTQDGLEALVETAPAGDGGYWEESVTYLYEFLLLPDGSLQLSAIQEP